MKTQKELEEVRKKLESLPRTTIKYLNENQGSIVRDVAYMTPETMLDIQNIIGARRVYTTYTPAMITKGIILVFEF